jgi:hypothetical protein
MGGPAIFIRIGQVQDQILQFQRLAESRLANAKPAAVRATIALAIKRTSNNIDLGYGQE